MQILSFCTLPSCILGPILVSGEAVAKEVDGGPGDEILGPPGPTL